MNTIVCIIRFRESQWLFNLYIQLTPSNPLFALLVFATAFLTALLIRNWVKWEPSSGRFQTIDSFRGFLALGVFLHHSNIWNGYLQNNKWESPASKLYQQFGHTSVVFFFMITSFLFVTKLLNTGRQSFNFKSFFLGRFFRLVPMFYFSLMLSIITIMTIEHWHLNVPLSQFLSSLLPWLGFNITWVSINNSPYTSITDAGVTWSLPYEWLFYFGLPLLSLLFLKKKPQIKYILISIVFILLFRQFHSILDFNTYSFGGGIVAAIANRSSAFRKFSASYIGVLIIIACFLMIGFTENREVQLIYTSIIFSLIACGNHLLGILKSKTLQFLGDICYSTYLLHGITIFTTFYFVLGFAQVKAMSQVHYCYLIIGITPILIIVSYLGFKYIEQPFMKIGRRVGNKTKD